MWSSSRNKVSEVTGDSEAEIENESITLGQGKLPWLSKTIDGCLLIILVPKMNLDIKQD